MKIHKEGRKIVSWIFIILILINSLSFFVTGNIKYTILLFIASTLFIIFIFRFFRAPGNRNIVLNDNVVFAPADGKIVVIEETEETEFFNEKRIQISIFMSIWNVHINWFPISGIIKYFKYHSGKFLIAKKPKSSTENERTTIVIENVNKVHLLVRQIAGTVARRIISYVKVNKEIIQGEELGFIRFGSRVDVFLPLSAKINVQLNQKVRGNKTIIAELS